MNERDFSNKSLKSKVEEQFGRTITEEPPKPKVEVAAKPSHFSDKVQDKFEFTTPTKVIQLPSGSSGLYPEIPDGKITIKPIEQREVDILNTDHLIKKNLAFDKAIDNCIISPKVSSNILISGDKVFLLFSLFEYSKGTSLYEFSQTCPNCKNKNIINIDFNDVPLKSLEISKNEFIIEELPISIIMNSTSASKLIDSTSTEVLNASIDEVSGVPEESKKEFIKRLIFGDSLYIREHMNKNTPGMNPVFDFSCVHCEYTDEMLIPITAGFFSIKI
jgi:hypothetical protein